MLDIQNKKIKLRGVEPSDLEFIYRIENDSENWTISGTSTPFSKNTLEKYIDSIQDIYSDRQLRIVICDANDKGIGLLDLFDFEPKNQRAGIGILIDKPQRGNGYGAESLKLVIQYCFETLFLHQVYCNIMESNIKSIKLFESLGFIQCGRKKEWIRTKYGWEDELIYQLVKS